MNRPRITLTACLIIGLIAPAAGLGQDLVSPSRQLAYDGTHLFRLILKTQQMKPLLSEDELWQQPEASILIVLGKPTMLQDFDVERFIARKGAVLVATDHDLDVQGIHVVGERIEAAIPGETYQGLPYCPLITDVQGAELFGPIGRRQGIATNLPGYLEPSPAFEEIAWFPNSSRREGDGKRLPHATFAMRLPKEEQRLLVLADHSIFINRMMMQPDNDNFLVAWNCVQWLSADQRKRVLFCEDGQVVKSFDVEVRELPPDLPDPVALINGLLTKWERENVHNELLLERFRSPAQLLSILALLATAALAVYVFFRIQQSQHRMETSP